MSIGSIGDVTAGEGVRGGAQEEASRREAAQIRRAAQQFEALMLQQVFKAMQKAASMGSESGLATDIFQGQFVQHVSEQAAGSGGIGLAEVLAEAWGGRREGEVSALSDWQLPVRGRHTSKWGERVHPVTGERSFHHGLDIAAPAGTPVRPTAAGRVVVAGERGGYGRLIEIEHANGWVSRYAHLRRLEVKEGDWVSREQVIGEVGSTGMSTGPHLHLECRRGGRSFSPEELLLRGPRRGRFELKDEAERVDVGITKRGQWREE